MDDYEKYLNMALRFLTYRGRSEREVRDYLLKKNASEDIADRIIERCKEYGYINDEKFAKDWTSSRSTHRLKSKRIIKMELAQKGLDREVIEKTMDEGAGAGIDEDEQARQLVEKRIGRLKGLPREEIFRKLAGYLGRRGYDYGTIKRAIDDVMELEYNK
jgi:regulatory protein